MNIFCKCFTVMCLMWCCQLLAEKRPNFVIIMVDDLGYSDLSTYGGEIVTPNLNDLAEKGMKFSQFYNAARCVPSRASLLTGLYPHQAGLGFMVSDRGYEGYRGDLSKKSSTIAEVLGSQGYFTAMAGKWHVTKNWRLQDNKDNWPLQRGFDRFYGTLPGHGSLYNPYGLVEGNNPATVDDGFYYTEAIGAKSVEFIEQAANAKQPLFLYIAHVAPHYPLHAKPEKIEQQKGLFNEGWDVLRKKRFENLVSLGLINESTKLSPRDEQVPMWADEPNKKWQQHRMEVYAAMIAHVDDTIKQVVDALKKTNQLENTYIVFMSDNGASAEGHLNNTIERLDKPWRSALIPKTTSSGETVKAGDWVNEPIGGPTTYGSYGIKWANLSNTPFRNHKSWVHEGGISSPLIVVGPGIEGGHMSSEPVHLIDIMPTLIDLAGVKPSVKESLSLEGITLSEHLLQRSQLKQRALYWEHEGNRAIRLGDWKLVSEYPGSWAKKRAYEKAGNWELYNIAQDRTELEDLANLYPNKVKTLEKMWNIWAERVGVVSVDKFTNTQKSD